MSSSNNGLCNSDYFVMGAPWSTPPPTITIPSVADLQDLSLPSVMAEKPKTLLAMLCMPTSSLKLDDTGQLRYFGPTASLHTAQGSAAPFTEWAALATADHCPNNDLPEELQASLLDLYWKYQHPVLQIVHKEAFLMDMKSKSCRYYSKALLYAMLASAAKVSESLHIRNLALNKDSSASSSEPYLVKKTMILVDEELDENAGLTTIQALHLLSVAHCCRGNDQKGWMDAGRAIRLAFDLGLHKSLDEMDAHNHLKLDQEVRKTVLWGSFVFDRYVNQNPTENTSFNLEQGLGNVSRPPAYDQNVRHFDAISPH